MTLREKVARAICSARGGDPDELDAACICDAKNQALPLWQYWEEEADAALDVVREALWEPTWQMVNDGTVAALEHRLHGMHRSKYSSTNAGEVYAAYKALYAASPLAEGNGDAN